MAGTDEAMMGNMLYGVGIHVLKKKKNSGKQKIGQGNAEG